MDIKLKKLSKILGESVNITNLQDISSKLAKKDKALDDLYSLSKDFKYTNLRLEKHNIDKEKFKEIYRKLELLGAGQWIKGHYVAASSLVFGSTL